MSWTSICQSSSILLGGKRSQTKLATDLIAAHRSKSFGNKNDILNFIKNWILDNYPLVLEFIQVSKRALSSMGMSPKRKRRDDGEEEDDHEAYSRRAET